MTLIKFLKYLGALLGTILAGAIGSGVWEKFLSPFVSFLTNTTINTLSKLSIDYSNNIYTKVAENAIANSNSRINSFTVIFTILMICLMFLSHLSSDRLGVKQSLIPPMIATVFLIVISLYISGRESYIHKVSTNSHLNLEIIRPYLGETKYLQLKSSFFQIKSKKDFDIFEKQVSKCSIENNLSLKNFSDN